MKETLYNLVIGNIDGSKFPDMSHFSVAAITKAQANQEKSYKKNLMSLIRVKRH